jgi:hypothetical protein
LLQDRYEEQLERDLPLTHYWESYGISSSLYADTNGHC